MSNQKNHDIKARLLATFRVEAQEHIQAITANLLALERGLPPDEAREAVEATFRRAHTLKGAARAVSLTDVEALCQACESLLSRLTRGQMALTRPILNRLQEAVDGLAHLLVGGGDPATVRDLIRRLEAGEAPGDRDQGTGIRDQGSGIGGQELTPIPHPPPPVLLADTIRLATAKLDALLLQAEDLLVPKLAAGERVREARSLVEALGRPHPPSPDLREVENQARALLSHLVHDERATKGVVDGLADELLQIRLMPASTVLALMPRMVRDLAQEKGKEVELVTHDPDLEVDRKVLEAIKDPLIHLVRNAIDHGIEPPEDRSLAGKPRRGRVAVTIAPLEGSRIEIRVEDDGGGIDLARVRAAAVRARLLTEEEAQVLPDNAALDLIFRSGLSTSPIITDLSGHGLGMAIVKEHVERLAGQIRVETEARVGTTVRLILPATIATFLGLLVRAGGQPFLLPIEAVERAIRIAPEQIESVEGRKVVRWNGRPLSLAWLSDLLELPQEQGLGVGGQGSGDRGQELAPGPRPPFSGPRPPTPGPRPLYPCVILRSGEERVGLLVEEIQGDREVLVKEFAPPLIRVRTVAGAGLLGTGQVVLILRPADLVKSIRESPRPPAPAAPPEERGRQHVILVVDDSITTRTMEKNLLEMAGYQVRVAVDGIEAWTALNSEEIDLVVADVDMPRMDGFELTARVRADRKLADLPVVLVTALESRENKGRGIEVGANAYVVKSSFDQSNLLEIIRRLI